MEWSELTRLTADSDLAVERVRLIDSGIAIEGQFQLPPMARLTAEDQLFVAAFVRCHGSIKRMEELFGVSYPTIKSRLNRIGEKFDFVNVQMALPGDREEILLRLDCGEISVNEALQLLEKGETDE